MQSEDGHRPGVSEVLVRVHECGVCGSDLKMWAGTHAFMRPPIVMGHEIAGVVEQAADGIEIPAGTAVTLFPPIGCGSCFHCRRGQEQLCEAMEFIGGQRPGGFADYLVAPASHVIPIPADVPTAQRVLIEPLSVAVHAVARGGPVAGDECVVIGAGPIGLLTALVLRERQHARVVVADVQAGRRRIAERAGFETLDPTVERLSEGVRRLIRPEGADLAFECVGSQETIAAALEMTRKGGTTVVAGNAPAALQVDGLALQRGDRSLVGVLMYDLEDFRLAMRLLAEGLLEPIGEETLLVRYGIERIDEAFADAKAGDLAGLKAVVTL